ncbi:J domain-containing protein [Anaeromicropila herbilytica]|uniref:J domain-containing protein n=1 Tax=Anaeromicropila herbilytica TaxID=2785025 RepID=A0A7R7IDK5_9FIRM|nr:J domain-containing protein [Anaeromicropila herbilytica]BCN31056.1 hypothetical protein bsdtb5_23510 [Anaeromicropila herbilytica]
MTIKEAASILGVTSQDDVKTIKQKFRIMMGQYHPDVVESDKPEHIKKAQLINEAYSILREYKVNEKEIPIATPVWKAKVIENAFTERNIYMVLWEDYEKEYIEVTRGKYEWDPDLEEFDCLLKSLNHAVVELLENIEHKNGIYYDYDIKANRFPFQVRLFHILSGQYILPVSCLKKLVEPIKIDAQKRNIYKFQALLGTKGESKIFRAMIRLKKGDLLYADSLMNNRIVVSDENGTSLGHLYFSEDSLYYVIIPILQKHLAQVKFVVNALEVKRNIRPYAVRVNIDLYLRMEHMEEIGVDSCLNLTIEDVLNSYDSNLKDMKAKM